MTTRFKTSVSTIGAGLAFCAIACTDPVHETESLTPRESGQAIIGGVELASSAIPQAVALVDRMSGALCSGTVIDVDRVATAAHCLVSQGRLSPASAFEVVTTSRVEEATWDERRPVIGVSIHPEYRGGEANDIAWVRVERPFDFQPAVLDPEPLAQMVQDPDQMFIVGYGIENPDAGIEADGRGIKRVGTARVAVGSPSAPGSFVAEAGDSSATWTSTSACYGDSGGPALRVGVDAEGTLGLLVSGLASYALGSDCSTGYVGYQSVSHHSDFLGSNVATLPSGLNGDFDDALVALSGPTPPMDEELLVATFDNGTEGFTYNADPISFSDTVYLHDYADGWHENGALVVELGGFDQTGPNRTEGGWSTVIDVPERSEIEVTFRFTWEVSPAVEPIPEEPHTSFVGYTRVTWERLSDGFFSQKVHSLEANPASGSSVRPGDRKGRTATSTFDLEAGQHRITFIGGFSDSHEAASPSIRSNFRIHDVRVVRQASDEFVHMTVPHDPSGLETPEPPGTPQIDEWNVVTTTTTDGNIVTQAYEGRFQGNTVINGRFDIITSYLGRIVEVSNEGGDPSQILPPSHHDPIAHWDDAEHLSQEQRDYLLEAYAKSLENGVPAPPSNNATSLETTVPLELSSTCDMTGEQTGPSQGWAIRGRNRVPCPSAAAAVGIAAGATTLVCGVSAAYKWVPPCYAAYSALYQAIGLLNCDCLFGFRLPGYIGQKHCDCAGELSNRDAKLEWGDHLFGHRVCVSCPTNTHWEAGAGCVCDSSGQSPHYALCGNGEYKGLCEYCEAQRWECKPEWKFGSDSYFASAGDGYVRVTSCVEPQFQPDNDPPIAGCDTNGHGAYDLVWANALVSASGEAEACLLQGTMPPQTMHPRIPKVSGREPASYAYSNCWEFELEPETPCHQFDATLVPCDYHQQP